MPCCASPSTAARCSRACSRSPSTWCWPPCSPGPASPRPTSPAEVLFPELGRAAGRRGGAERAAEPVRVPRRGCAGTRPGLFLAAQLDPADLARDRLGQLGELDPADPLVRGPPGPG